MPKVTVVGAGNVGATCAFVCASWGLADVVITDVVDGLPQGKGLDMTAALPMLAGAGPVTVTGSNDLSAAKGSDVVVITAGLARKPGMDRMDLLAKNASIVGGVAEAVGRYAPKAIIINVTNPLDVMAYVAMKKSAFPPERVIGMAGVLDSARFSAFLAAELGCPADQVQAMVLGGHGDSMVPLVSSATAGGIPVTQLLSADRIAKVVERTRKAGAEVVALLKTGSAFYSPGAAAAVMVRAVLRDERRILPAAAFLRGEYGARDIYMGVPVVLGASGVEKILELELSAEESSALARSAAEVAGGIKELGGLKL